MKMHPRHRGAGNGYRPNSMGMGGVATASRVSPEGSMRGRGFYNSEYRNYNRGGFGRGQRRQFQPLQPPTRKGDIFMEAGRLAAEYLVSKGVLPPNALLPGKWLNGSFRNQFGDFRGVRSMEGDGPPLSADGRTSADSQVGNAATETGPGRRYFDEQNSMGSRNYIGGRRRSGSFKNYGSDWKREVGRSGPWSERGRESPAMEVDVDSSLGHNNEQEVGKEGHTELHTPPLSQETPKSENVGHAGPASERNKLIDNESAVSSNSEKVLPSEADAEPTDGPRDAKRSDIEGGEVKDEVNYDKLEQQFVEQVIPVESSVVEENLEANKSSNLLKFCRFANVPTKTRSSLTTKSIKPEQYTIAERKDSNVCGLPENSMVNADNEPVDCSSINDSSKQSPNSRSIECDVKNAPEVEKEDSPAYVNRKENCLNVIPSPEKSLMQEEQKGNNELPGFERLAPMLMERGEKRALDDAENWSEMKKPREWTSSTANQTDGCLGLSKSMEMPQTSAELITSNIGPHQKRMASMALQQKSEVSCIDYAGEKQLLPGSFKTFDLNLMEASEANESHDTNPVIAIPSIMESGKQPMPVDIDLSVGNNGNTSGKFDKWGSHGKGIEVIDLENDSAQEEKAFSSSGKRPESEFAGVDGFPYNPQQNNDIPDVQDGYGLMIMELLGNDIPNCSSVPPDMNSLHNDMSLPNGEGILGDDDSIYTALGDIPTSFLRVWEQPNQEYGKPF